MYPWGNGPELRLAADSLVGRIANDRGRYRAIPHRSGRSGTAGSRIVINRSTSAGVTPVPAKSLAGPRAVVTMPSRRRWAGDGRGAEAAGFRISGVDGAFRVVAEPPEHASQHRASGGLQHHHAHRLSQSPDTEQHARGCSDRSPGGHHKRIVRWDSRTLCLQ